MMASQTIKEKFVELKNSKQTPPNARPKIQRVQEYLRSRKNFEQHYSPKLVSIGPIHHDNPTLKLGEKYKLMWAAKYIENTGLIPEELHKKIADNIDELKGRFSDDVLTLTGNSLQGFECLDEKLSWILFMDGCSLLHILDNIMYLLPMNIKVDQLALVREDVLLLENQLPYEVLKLLWKDEDESGLIKSMRSFHNCIYFVGSEAEKEKEGNGEHSVSIPNESQSETPTHLLDLQRKIILTTSNSKKKINEAKIREWRWKNSEENIPITYRGIEDLRAVGIRLKASATGRPTDVDFTAGWFTAKLTIPVIYVNNLAASTLLTHRPSGRCEGIEIKRDFVHGLE
uniref:DUF247 domain protein n=1 Tax=Medicago truncatula TaxID=3880 RepID=I3T567_MEDTR|nr:unknown [Medicago truncatula]